LPTQAELDAAAAAAETNANNNDEETDDDTSSETDVERLRNQLRAARKSESQLKRQTTTLSKERDELRQGQMTETERLQAERDAAIRERDAAHSQLRERDARTFVESEARKANAIRPEVVYRLLDIEDDDDGKPINVPSELRKLKNSAPELFGAAGSADGGSGRGVGPNTRGPGVSDAIRQSMGLG